MKSYLISIIKPALMLVIIIVSVTAGLQLFSWLQTDETEVLYDYVITAQMYHERLDDDTLLDDFHILQLSVLDSPTEDLEQVKIQVMSKLLSVEGYVSTLNWLYPPTDALFIYNSIMSESDIFQQSFNKLLSAIISRLQEDSATCIELCSEAEDLFDEALSLREQNRRSLNNLLYLAESTLGNHGAQKPRDYITQIRVFVPSDAVFLQPLDLNQSLLTNGVVTQTYVWEFEGKQWAWELDVPVILYDYYKALPRNADDYSAYISNPFDDSYIEGMVAEIEKVAKSQGFNKRETVEFVVSFVQRIPYTYDKDSTDYSDYPRYPIETIGERTGDCEDTSILLLSIIDQMGIEGALVHFVKTEKTSGHYGVSVSELQETYGKNWTYNGLQYYYIETNEIGSKIGAIPEEWQNIDPDIVSIKRVPFIVCDWNIDESEIAPMVEITVDNLGEATVRDIRVVVDLYSFYDEFACSDNLGIIEYNEQSPQFELRAGESITVNLMLPISIDTTYAPFVYVMHYGLMINHNAPN